ncbi:hypothetical protein B0G52_1181, partial [Cohnella sp. SGD-V74]
SVGAKHAEKAYKLHLQQLLAEYDLAMEQLQVIENEVTAALAKIPFTKPLLEIKGLSILSVAGILGEAGDLSGSHAWKTGFDCNSANFSACIRCGLTSPR